MSPIQPQDYFDVSPRPSGRCTVLYGRTGQTSKPLLISHHIVYLRGAETTRHGEINMYKPDVYVWKYDLCRNIMISDPLALEVVQSRGFAETLAEDQWCD